MQSRDRGDCGEDEVLCSWHFRRSEPGAKVGFGPRHWLLAVRILSNSTHCPEQPVRRHGHTEDAASEGSKGGERSGNRREGPC